VPLSEHETRRTWQYARAIRNRMRRVGLVCGVHYKELSNGQLTLYWPIKVNNA
jgi:hypothetical protein